MNTDQAYELLKDAGVAEDICIQTVRRWLLERKVKFEATKQKIPAGYILEDTDQAFNLLKDAGVASSIGIQIVKRWLREGKIEHVGDGNQLSDYITQETTSKRMLNNASNQDKVIRQLKAKIKSQDEHIKGLEELHKSSINNLLQQRDALNKQIATLEKNNHELQKEMGKLLKDNLELRKELLNVREELRKENQKSGSKVKQTVPTKPYDFRQKLGLSTNASNKEIIAGYKRLLKITHPDQGGNPIAFQYIKKDYDYFRNRMSE